MFFLLSNENAHISHEQINSPLPVWEQYDYYITDILRIVNTLLTISENVAKTIAPFHEWECMPKESIHEAGE
jgi:hypothetical protein